MDKDPAAETLFCLWTGRSHFLGVGGARLYIGKRYPSRCLWSQLEVRNFKVIYNCKPTLQGANKHSLNYIACKMVIVGLSIVRVLLLGTELCRIGQIFKHANSGNPVNFCNRQIDGDARLQNKNHRPQKKWGREQSAWSVMIVQLLTCWREFKSTFEVHDCSYNHTALGTHYT